MWFEFNGRTSRPIVINLVLEKGLNMAIKQLVPSRDWVNVINQNFNELAGSDTGWQKGAVVGDVADSSILVSDDGAPKNGIALTQIYETGSFDAYLHYLLISD